MQVIKGRRKLVVFLLVVTLILLVYFLYNGYSLHIPLRLPSIHPQIVYSGNESLSVYSVGSGFHDYALIGIGVNMNNHDTFELLENQKTIVKIEKNQELVNDSFFTVSLHPIMSDDSPDRCTSIRNFSGEWVGDECIIDFDKLPEDTDIALSLALGGWNNSKEGFGISIASFPGKDVTAKRNPFVWVKKWPLLLSVKFDSLAPVNIVDSIKLYYYPLYLEKDGYLLP